MSKTAPASPALSPAQQQREPGTSAPHTAAAVSFRARRRRPGMAVLAAALIAAGGAGGFLAWQKTGERMPVLAVTQSVAAGDVIDESDLTDASVSLDPALKPFPAGERDKVVGKRAAVALVPGALLSRGQVTDRSLVQDGEQLVGIGLKPDRLPATRLSAGDRVLVVYTPADGAADRSSADPGPDADGGTAPQAPTAVSARVVRVGEPQQATGDVVVDVAVPQAQGPGLAAQAATGRIALVVEPGGKS
ncbi:SAF domain-containing protein [Streptomyces sp. NBC_00306]|uniref:SAF domain-containing protein n=1 Tax=Streptomyces sp. NBC_00306 TaxID=2975708 RepID=UPI002E2A2E79|nr:SAF domain-containing protein [Streptomyces sp. NBC_00306]